MPVLNSLLSFHSQFEFSTFFEDEDVTGEDSTLVENDPSDCNNRFALKDDDGDDDNGDEKGGVGGSIVKVAFLDGVLDGEDIVEWSC